VKAAMPTRIRRGVVSVLHGMTDPRRLLVLAGAVAGAAIALVSCSATGTLNALARSDTYRPTTGVAYGPLPRHKLDVYTPTAPPPAAGWPVVVFFYGGNWVSGERGDYMFMGEALASRGVLAIVADAVARTRGRAQRHRPPGPVHAGAGAAEGDQLSGADQLRQPDAVARTGTMSLASRWRTCSGRL